MRSRPPPSFERLRSTTLLWSTTAHSCVPTGCRDMTTQAEVTWPVSSRRSRRKWRSIFSDLKFPISIIGFLVAFKLACDLNNIQGGGAMWVLPHYITETLANILQSRKASGTIGQQCLKQIWPASNSKRKTYCPYRGGWKNVATTNLPSKHLERNYQRKP